MADFPRTLERFAAAVEVNDGAGLAALWALAAAFHQIGIVTAQPLLFIANVGEERLTVPTARGLTFYQVMSLASIVEREAMLDEERPLIAGVYQNRIDGIPGVKNKILNADPTVFYAWDTVKLEELGFDRWKEYTFWKPPGVPLREIQLPESLLGYQTYTQPGLIPGPIATPTLASIDAALHPDTADKYIYFLAVPGTSNHVFAKTDKEHNANRKKYGYT